MVEGWTQADALVAGDVILNGNQQPLTLLAMMLDDTAELLPSDADPPVFTLATDRCPSAYDRL